ncbi:hypothetical protein BRAS3809_2390020 [Bradyrhizobium sp. STM 3809]|nr:hypothetical protein BRAS3809_2390020 [Bradyrhizobium sp. STM 3809]
MASWFELLVNIIGYGGFVVIASRPHADSAGATADMSRDEAGDT